MNRLDEKIFGGNQRRQGDNRRLPLPHFIAISKNETRIRALETERETINPYLMATTADERHTLNEPEGYCLQVLK